MIKNTELEFIEAIQDGSSLDVVALRGNFDKIEEALNEHRDEIESTPLRVTNTISFAIDTAGLTKILRNGKHTNLKIVNAFVQMGDSVKDEATVGLVGISDAVRFSKTEKAGKVRILNLNKTDIKEKDEILVSTSSNRRVIVNVTYEGEE